MGEAANVTRICWCKSSWACGLVVLRNQLLRARLCRRREKARMRLWTLTPICTRDQVQYTYNAPPRRRQGAIAKDGREDRCRSRNNAVSALMSSVIVRMDFLALCLGASSRRCWIFTSVVGLGPTYFHYCLVQNALHRRHCWIFTLLIIPYSSDALFLRRRHPHLKLQEALNIRQEDTCATRYTAEYFDLCLECW